MNTRHYLTLLEWVDTSKRTLTVFKIARQSLSKKRHQSYPVRLMSMISIDCVPHAVESNWVALTCPTFIWHFMTSSTNCDRICIRHISTTFECRQLCNKDTLSICVEWNCWWDECEFINEIAYFLSVHCCHLLHMTLLMMMDLKVDSYFFYHDWLFFLLIRLK
jgi:hypothetical protein